MSQNYTTITQDDVAINPELAGRVGETVEANEYKKLVGMGKGNGIKTETKTKAAAPAETTTADEASTPKKGGKTAKA